MTIKHLNQASIQKTPNAIIVTLDKQTQHDADSFAKLCAINGADPEKQSGKLLWNADRLNLVVPTDFGPVITDQLCNNFEANLKGLLTDKGNYAPFWRSEFVIEHTGAVCIAIFSSFLNDDEEIDLSVEVKPQLICFLSEKCLGEEFYMAESGMTGLSDRLLGDSDCIRHQLAMAMTINALGGQQPYSIKAVFDADAAYSV